MLKILKIQTNEDDMGSFEVDGKIVESIVAEVPFGDMKFFRVRFCPGGIWSGPDILVNATVVIQVTIEEFEASDDQILKS